MVAKLDYTLPSNVESQYDSALRVKLTRIFRSLSDQLDQFTKELSKLFFESSVAAAIRMSGDYRELHIGAGPFTATPNELAVLKLSGTSLANSGGSVLLLKEGVALAQFAATNAGTYLDSLSNSTFIRMGATYQPAVQVTQGLRTIFRPVAMTGFVDNGTAHAQGRAGEYSFASTCAINGGVYYHAKFCRGESVTQDGQITSSGGTTTYATTSDRRRKKDIVDAPSAEVLIGSLRVVSHNWRDNDAHVPYSFIAQEVDEVYPRAVTRGMPGIADDGTGDELPAGATPWGIDNSILVPVLVKAMQEQAERIHALSERIAAMENQ